MKTILHLCADIGSDSAPYQDAGYNVILVGKEIGVENYTPPDDVYGIFANPVCTDFSIAKNSNHNKKPDDILLRHCQRIIAACDPMFWVIENPATGKMKQLLGKPDYAYEPWWYGSPWTKKTALWGRFNIPQRKYHNWEEVPKNEKLYVRKGRKCSLVWLHKSAIKDIPEFHRFEEKVTDDMSFRSLCSQNFATDFYEVNK